MNPSIPSVYLADPDRLFRNELALALEQAGVDVSVFANGSDLGALPITSSPDLIVLGGDPDDMGGAQIFARLKCRRTGRRYPLVLVIDKSQPLEQIVTSVQGFLSDWRRLGVRNLAAVFTWLQMREKTGRLELEAFGERGVILLSRGEILEARWKELHGSEVLRFFAEELPEQGFRFAERADGVQAGENRDLQVDGGRRVFTRPSKEENGHLRAPVAGTPAIGPGGRAPRLGRVPVGVADVTNLGPGVRPAAPEPDLHIELARDLIERRHLDEACLHLRTAAASFARQLGEAQYLMGIAQLARGDVATAVKELHASLRCLPDDLRVAGVLDAALERLDASRPREPAAAGASPGARDRTAAGVTPARTVTPTRTASLQPAPSSPSPQKPKAAPDPRRVAGPVTRELPREPERSPSGGPAQVEAPLASRTEKPPRSDRRSRRLARSGAGLAVLAAACLAVTAVLGGHVSVPGGVFSTRRDFVRPNAQGSGLRVPADAALSSERAASAPLQLVESSAMPEPSNGIRSVAGPPLEPSAPVGAAEESAGAGDATPSAEPDPAYTLDALRAGPTALRLDSRPQPRRLVDDRTSRTLVDGRSATVAVIRSWGDLTNAETRVEMWVLVNASGRVDDVRLVRSSGRSDLDEEAMSAIRELRYSPGRRDGAEVPAWTLQSVTFRSE